jgi:uncharacterized protein YjiS (DUF1127 family)
MNTSITTTARTAGPIGRIKSGLSRWAAAVAAARARRRTYQVLSSLDDRTLHDIGLTRTMLLSVSVHGIRALNGAAPPESALNPR